MLAKTDYLRIIEKKHADSLQLVKPWWRLAIIV